MIQYYSIIIHHYPIIIHVYLLYYLQFTGFNYDKIQINTSDLDEHNYNTGCSSIALAQYNIEYM